MVLSVTSDFIECLQRVLDGHVPEMIDFNVLNSIVGGHC